MEWMVELVDNGDNITIISQSQPEDNFTTRSDLSVRVTGDEDFTEYFCVGDNQFDNTTSDNRHSGASWYVKLGVIVMSVWIIKVDHVPVHNPPLFLLTLLPHPQFLPHSSENPSNVTAAIGDSYQSQLHSNWPTPPHHHCLGGERDRR